MKYSLVAKLRAYPRMIPLGEAGQLHLTLMRSSRTVADKPSTGPEAVRYSKEGSQPKMGISIWVFHPFVERKSILGWKKRDKTLLSFIKLEQARSAIVVFVSVCVGRQNEYHLLLAREIDNKNAVLKSKLNIRF